MTIVVGFIDTPEGWAAVNYAAQEAKSRAANVVLVNSMRGGRHDDAEDYEAVREAMEKATAVFEDAGVEFQVHEFVRGNNPADDLIGASVQHKADLIVIGIRRRTATGKALLGSNALDILHDATVPVVCVKAEQG